MIKPSNPVLSILVAGIALLGACREANRSAAGDTIASGTYQPGSLEGFRPRSASGGGDSSGSPSAQTAVEANIRAMMGASSSQIQSMIPQHRQLVTSMIGQMNGEMGSMHTGGSNAWVAVTDSVNRDLIRFPAMSALELQATLPSHAGRLHRLMLMRTGAVGGMGRMMPNR